MKHVYDRYLYLSDILTASEALLLLLLLFVELPSPAESGFSGFFPGLLTPPVVLLNELKFFLICRKEKYLIRHLSPGSAAEKIRV